VTHPVPIALVPPGSEEQETSQIQGKHGRLKVRTEEWFVILFKHILQQRIQISMYRSEYITF